MTHAEVAAFEDIMGPLDETTEEVLSDGRVALNEFRDVEAPMCAFQEGALRYISVAKSDRIDFRFQNVSLFDDDPKQVYSTLGRAAGAVFMHDSWVVMPSLNLRLAGFVMAFSPKGTPPIFGNKETGFTWPELGLFQSGYGLFEDMVLVEISNEAV